MMTNVGCKASNTSGQGRARSNSNGGGTSAPRGELSSISRKSPRTKIPCSARGERVLDANASSPLNPSAYRPSFFTNASTNASRLGSFAVKSIGIPAAFIVSLVCLPMLPASGRVAPASSFNAAA